MALPVLSDLEFNASDVAEAVASKVASENSNIGTLASQAQTSKESIDTLLTQAQTAKDSIDDLLTAVSSTETYYTTTLDGNWSSWGVGTSTSLEGGVRLQRFGKVYIAHINALRTSNSLGYNLNETIISVTSSDITLPSSSIKMGSNFYGGSSNTDIVYFTEFKTDGDLVVHFNNEAGNTTFILGSFVGVDQG